MPPQDGEQWIEDLVTPLAGFMPENSALDSTVDSFWSMLKEHKVKIGVMLGATIVILED